MTVPTKLYMTQAKDQGGPLHVGPQTAMLFLAVWSNTPLEYYYNIPTTPYTQIDTLMYL